MKLRLAALLSTTTLLLAPVAHASSSVHPLVSHSSDDVFWHQGTHNQKDQNSKHKGIKLQNFIMSSVGDATGLVDFIPNENETDISAFIHSHHDLDKRIKFSAYSSALRSTYVPKEDIHNEYFWNIGKVSLTDQDSVDSTLSDNTSYKVSINANPYNRAKVDVNVNFKVGGRVYNRHTSVYLNDVEDKGNNSLVFRKSIFFKIHDDGVKTFKEYKGRDYIFCIIVQIDSSDKSIK